MGTAARPDEIYAVEKGAPRPLTQQNDAWLAEVRLGAVEETQLQEQGRNRDPRLPGETAGLRGRAKRYPTILRLHGGPVGQFECSFDEEWQWFAANGYVVLAPNPRGSSGRGRSSRPRSTPTGATRHAGRARRGRRCRGARHRRSRPARRRRLELRQHADELRHRLDQRFKAATSGAGSSNILAGYGSDQYIREYEQELGPPWKNIEAGSRSPFRSCTPTGSPRRRSFSAAREDFNMPMSARSRCTRRCAAWACRRSS